MHRTVKLSLLLALGVGAANAQNPNYAPGDLVLYFQQYGGSNTVAVNLGAATTYRDATSNITNIVNIGSDLSNATTGFGSSWYDSSTLFWGAAGVYNNSTSTAIQTNGDPGRTLYVSSVRTAPGTEGEVNSAGWTVDSNGSMTTGANGIIAQNNRLETQSLTTTLAEGTSTSNIDNQNPFNINGTPTNSFSVFPGSVEGGFGSGQFGSGSFGGVNNVEAALDLYRILATTNPGGTVWDGVSDVRVGTYEGTFVVDNTGSLSYLAATTTAVPEPSSAGILLLGLSGLMLARRRRKTAL